MVNSLIVILVSFSVSATFSKDLCSRYEDEACILPSSTKNGFYVNQWSVHMPGVHKEEARQILEEELGFVYLGQVHITIFSSVFKYHRN